MVVGWLLLLLLRLRLCGGGATTKARALGPTSTSASRGSKESRHHRIMIVCWAVADVDDKPSCVFYPAAVSVRGGRAQHPSIQSKAPGSWLGLEDLFYAAMERMSGVA